MFCAVPEDETERLNLAWQIREWERDVLPLVEIVKLEGLEVADQHVAGPRALGKRVEILLGLTVGFLQIAPSTLLFDDQDAGPEQVDIARAIAQFGDMFLVACDGSPSNAEHLEEVVVEALCLALLVSRVLPVMREGGGAGADLVP